MSVSVIYIRYDIFVNCNRVYTRWQYYSTHLHTNSTYLYNNTNNNRTTQITTNMEECRPCPVFASFTLEFALQLRKKHGKTSVRVAEEEYASTHITKTPTHYKTYTHTSPHITKPTCTHTHTPTHYTTI
jgi:hypothetical protein